MDTETAVVAAKIIEEINVMCLNHEEPKTNKKVSFVETYGLKAGIKKFGKKGKDAALSETGKLHNRKCFKPINPGNLSP